jgi:hypothetical protein
MSVTDREWEGPWTTAGNSIFEKSSTYLGDDEGAFVIHGILLPSGKAM